MGESEPRPGWYGDPNDPTLDRWWGGSGWTDRTRPAVEPTTADTGILPAVAPGWGPLGLGQLPLPSGAPVPVGAPPAGPSSHHVPRQIAPPTDGRAGGRQALPWILGLLVGVVVVLAGLIAFLLGSTSTRDRTSTAQPAPTTSLPATTAAAPTTTVPVPSTAAVALPPQTTIVYVPMPTTVPPATVSRRRASSAGSGAPTPSPTAFDATWSPPSPTGWVAQLASLPSADFSAAQVDDRIDALRASGLSAVVTWSGDWESLTSGYWVIVADEPFESGEAAVDFCHSMGLHDRDSCFGNIISQDADDSPYEVYP